MPRCRGRSRRARATGEGTETPRRRGRSRSSRAAEEGAEASPAVLRLGGPAVTPGEQRGAVGSGLSRVRERMESRAGRKQNE
jgi:hypothetical protein